MNLWLLCGSLILILSLASVVGFNFGGHVPAWVVRSAVVVSFGMMLPASYWMYLNPQVPAWATVLTASGSFLCGAAFTTSTAGLVEDNAPPSPGVREKILAYHTAANLRYPREPLGKRAFDVTLALAAITVTLPLWIAIALLVWFEEPGPIFFTKNSVGRGGITFRQMKFRSMVYDAERLTGPVASAGNDPRTLKIGRWLRRWHLDELPELLNVVGGTMSLVGPRPLRAVLVQEHLEDIPGFAERHTVRPGIACIAQIEKYHILPAERLRKDRVYIRRMSLALDVRLLWRAVVTTLHGERSDVPVSPL